MMIVGTCMGTHTLRSDEHGARARVRDARVHPLACVRLPCYHRPLYGHAEGHAEGEDSLAVEVETRHLSPPRRRWKAHMHTLCRSSALAVRACLAAIGRPSGLVRACLAQRSAHVRLCVALAAGKPLATDSLAGKALASEARHALVWTHAPCPQLHDVRAQSLRAGGVRWDDL